MLVVFCIKKRRAKDSKPTAESATTSHDNPTYDSSGFKANKNMEDNDYEESPLAYSDNQADLSEQYYVNIGGAITDEFADDEMYDYVKPPRGEGYELSFDNPGYAWFLRFSMIAVRLF